MLKTISKLIVAASFLFTTYIYAFNFSVQIFYISNPDPEHLEVTKSVNNAFYENIIYYKGTKAILYTCAVLWNGSDNPTETIIFKDIKADKQLCGFVGTPSGVSQATGSDGLTKLPMCSIIQQDKGKGSSFWFVTVGGDSPNTPKATPRDISAACYTP